MLTALALVAIMQTSARASSPATSEAIAVLYGKFDTQIQFVICLNSSDPAAQAIAFDNDRLSYSYTVTDPDGHAVGSGSSPAQGVTYVSMPTCNYGYPEAYAVNGLTPGTTYTITTTATLTPVNGGSDQVLTDTLVVTTTGGCPIGAPEEEVPRYTYLHALLDANNVVTVVNSIAPGTIHQEPWASQGTWVPTYFGWPGKQYAGIGYVYDPVTENFGPPFQADTSLPESDLLALAGFDGCASDPGYDVGVIVDPGSDDNCSVSGDRLLAVSAGVCEVQVTVRGAVRSGSGKRALRTAPTRSVAAMLVVRGTSAGGRGGSSSPASGGAGSVGATAPQATTVLSPEGPGQAPALATGSEQNAITSGAPAGTGASSASSRHERPVVAGLTMSTTGASAHAAVQQVRDVLAARAADAPQVAVRPHEPVRLALPNLVPGHRYRSTARSTGTSARLGTFRSRPDGTLVLPALTLARATTVTVTVADVATGRPLYLRISSRRR